MKRVVTVIAVLALAGVAAAAILSGRETSRRLGPVSTHVIARGDLLVSVTEQGTLESSNNTEIKCKVRGANVIISVIESGTIVEAGDELLRLETLLIEEEINERTKFAHLADSRVARSQADLARATIAISAYLEGQFISQMATIQKNLAIAKSSVLSAKNRLKHARMMARSEYKSELEVEENEFAVAQAERNMKLIQTRIDVLEKFTKKEELITLNGALNVAKATHEANLESAYADRERLNRAKEELQYCVIKADRGGMVIYPTGKDWSDSPEIEEGATVHKDQVLLLMPDLTKMQVKVGIHESIIDRIRPGLSAKVTMPGRSLEGDISYVAAVTKPAGWWTGNVVKYDTIVELPEVEGQKPGMTVEVEVVMARHKDVLLVPTTAVLETAKGHVCWVRQGDSTTRRPLKLGDSSDMFIQVEAGLAEGDEVILDPLANVEEAQTEAAKSLDSGVRRRSTDDEPKSVSPPPISD
jgi:multidrug efflux pump subunit AcrA (membrane-fusion protein)